MPQLLLVSEAFATHGGAVSRGVGFGLLGLSTGIAIGLVESALKDRWLYVTAGPLAGKQFILYKPETRIGSQQTCDIYLFKDAEILPDHAILTQKAGRLHLQASGPVYIGGQRIHSARVLDSGSMIQIGRYSAPVDEPAVSVSAADLVRPYSVSAAAVAAPPTPTPPPPRREGSTTSAAPPPRVALNGTPQPWSAPGPARTLTFGGYNAPQSLELPAPYIPRRSRITYILLGVLLGSFGGHNFYAGYTRRAVIQLLITLFTCFFGGIVSWIWALYEVCTVRHDDDGVPFI